MQNTPENRKLALWVFSGALAIIAISIVFAHAPRAMRRLGVNYAVYGIVCGFALGRLAHEFKLRRTSYLPIVSAVAVLLGGIQIGWASYQQLKSVRETEETSSPKQAAMQKLFDRLGSDEANKLAETEHSPTEITFMDYLKLRYSPLGNLNARVCVLFWSIELLLASLLSAWIVWRTPLAIDSTPQDPST